MYCDFGGDLQFSDALWATKKQRIIDLFMDKYPRRSRSTMTALACNSYTPVEIIEFILKSSSDLVYQWGGWSEKIEDRLKGKKRDAMRYAKLYLPKNEEELNDHEKSLIHDYLYLTGQRESCIKIFESPPVTSEQGEGSNNPSFSLPAISLIPLGLLAVTAWMLLAAIFTT
jgi:hypothetical protein